MDIWDAEICSVFGHSASVAMRIIDSVCPTKINQIVVLGISCDRNGHKVESRIMYDSKSIDNDVSHVKSYVLSTCISKNFQAASMPCC